MRNGSLFLTPVFKQGNVLDMRKKCIKGKTQFKIQYLLFKKNTNDFQGIIGIQIVVKTYYPYYLNSFLIILILSNTKDTNNTKVKMTYVAHL